MHSAQINKDSWKKPEIYSYILEADMIEEKELYKSNLDHPKNQIDYR